MDRSKSKGEDAGGSSIGRWVTVAGVLGVLGAAAGAAAWYWHENDKQQVAEADESAGRERVRGQRNELRRERSGRSRGPSQEQPEYQSQLHRRTMLPAFRTSYSSGLSSRSTAIPMSQGVASVPTSRPSATHVTSSQSSSSPQTSAFDFLDTDDALCSSDTSNGTSRSESPVAREEVSVVKWSGPTSNTRMSMITRTDTSAKSSDVRLSSVADKSKVEEREAKLTDKRRNTSATPAKSSGVRCSSVGGKSTIEQKKMKPTDKRQDVAATAKSSNVRCSPVAEKSKIEEKGAKLTDKRRNVSTDNAPDVKPSSDSGTSQKNSVTGVTSTSQTTKTSTNEDGTSGTVRGQTTGRAATPGDAKSSPAATSGGTWIHAEKNDSGGASASLHEADTGDGCVRRRSCADRDVRCKPKRSAERIRDSFIVDEKQEGENIVPPVLSCDGDSDDATSWSVL